jgi:hypothetical protein
VKPIQKLLSLVPVLVAPFVWAQPSPPITFTVRSYQSFTDGFTKIADTVSPGSAAEALGELREGLGIQDLKGIDKARPWQVAVWAEGLSTPPCVSIRVPVSDFAAFRDGLNPGLLQGDGNRIQEIGNYATVWLEFGPPSAATTEGEKAWKPDSLKAPAGLAQLVVRPGTALREELVGAVGMGRMAIGAAMANQDAQAMGGIDPKAMGELMSVYFDLIETGLKGLESLDVGVDLKNNKLTLDETIAPVAGSTLAGWLKTKDGNLGALASYLDANAPMALAMRFEENEGLMPTLKRLISLSMQMQGLPADSEAVRETEQLLEQFVPMHFAGNFDLKEGIQFGGVYRFPGKNPAEVYGTMKKFLQNSMQSQVGADKPYSSITVEEGQRKVGNVAVDRTTMVINLDAPMYQMPGQKEMIETMMPGGKMVFDYALKGEDLLMGSPARLDAILAGPAGTAYRPEGVSPRTVAYGYFNVFSLIPAIMAANPGISDDDKEKLAKIDATGTAIDFRVDLGNALHYQAGIPLKFFQTIGQVAD